MSLRKHYQAIAQVREAEKRTRLKMKAKRFELVMLSKRAGTEDNRAILSAVGRAMAHDPREILRALWGPLMANGDAETKFRRAARLFELAAPYEEDGIPDGWELTDEEACLPASKEELAASAAAHAEHDA